MMMSKRSKDSNFSVAEEPWLRAGRHEADPSEYVSIRDNSNQAEIDNLRDSVFSEPGYKGSDSGESEFRTWLENKRKSFSRSYSLGISLLVALIAGPFAIIGAFMAGRQTMFALIYAVLFGPVTEELLKQSGMIYLLERKPYHIFSKWQLIIGAVIGAGLFAVIENLMYIHIYLVKMPTARLILLSAFRWRVCTSLHLLCSLVASLGMIRVWRKHVEEARPADLSVGYPYFVVAIAMHGAYNLVAVVSENIGYF